VATLVLHISRSSSEINTRATVQHLRGKLSSLDTYISTMSYNIVKLNDYVKDLADALTARKETT